MLFKRTSVRWDVVDFFFVSGDSCTNVLLSGSPIANSGTTNDIIKAFDLVFTTWWEGGDNPQWIGKSFTEPKTVNCLFFVDRDVNNVDEFVVEAYNSEGTWVEVARIDDIDHGGTYNNYRYFQSQDNWVKQ